VYVPELTKMMSPGSSTAVALNSAMLLKGLVRRPSRPAAALELSMNQMTFEPGVAVPLPTRSVTVEVSVLFVVVLVTV
jgi:hypothetical protein